MTRAFLARLLDPGHRLTGEDPATRDIERARRWAEVYSRLIEFKRELLERTYRFTEESESEVARAMKETDIILLEAQLSRFEQRRDYWILRATELSGGRRVAGA